MKVFAGLDERELDGYEVFKRSVERTSPGVEVVPLYGRQGDGTTRFTLDRFRVPELMNWRGLALWVDGSDMLVRADLAGLFALADRRYAVQVVKHEYQTRHPRKFVGTSMEAANPNYARKNWSSVILWNCAHPAHWSLREGVVAAQETGSYLHRFSWLLDHRIGELPVEWNWLADE